MPRGCTELSVGGVVRLPVGCSPVAASAAQAVTTARLLFRSQHLVMIDLVNLHQAIKEARRERLAIGCEFQPEGPVGQFPDSVYLGEIRGAKQFDRAIG